MEKWRIIKLKLTTIILIAVLSIGSVVISLGFLTSQEYIDVPEISNQYEKLEKYKNELEKISDKFHPLRLKDLGSLARLTYDPEQPDMANLSLFALPHNNSWLIGYVTSIQMDEVFYQFNYLEMEQEPKMPFLKYRSEDGKDPELTSSFEHGYSYLSIIKIKNEHPIFSLNQA